MCICWFCYVRLNSQNYINLNIYLDYVTIRRIRKIVKSDY